MTRSSKKEEQQLLKEIYAAAQCRPAAKRDGVCQVGTFFVVEGKPFIDSTPVTESESYEHFKIHGRDHYQHWEQLQRSKAVASDVEYDEVPRRRVVYDANTRKYTLFLDRCILKDKKQVSRIMTSMNLPNNNTDTITDSRYRCPACLHKAGREE